MGAHGSMGSHEASERAACHRHGDLACGWAAAMWSTAARSSEPPGPARPCTGRNAGPASSNDVGIPAGAECGMLSVPVDYAKPDGDVAQLAMIRFKATGDKIGSLIINPGGPGESGVQAAASIVGTLPDSVRQRFDLVGFDPRGVGLSTPGGVVQLRRRQRPAAGRSPGRLLTRRRRAHRVRDQGLRPALRRQDGQGVPCQRRNRKRGKGSRRDAGRPRRQEADLPRVLVRHPDRVAVRRGLPAERARDDPRRCRRPQCRSGRSRHPAGGGLPDGVQRLRRRLREAVRTARSAPTRPRPSRSTRAWSIRWCRSPPRPRTRAAWVTATRSSAPSCRCTRRTCGATSRRR